MPLFVIVGVFAFLAMVAWQLSSRERVSPERTAASLAGVWVAMMLLVVLAWALGTLIFGR